MADERVQNVIDSLSSLIVSHARMTASEQYNPRAYADTSDELIRENQRWVAELRDIRQRFENLATGIRALETEPDSSLVEECRKARSFIDTLPFDANTIQEAHRALETEPDSSLVEECRKARAENEALKTFAFVTYTVRDANLVGKPPGSGPLRFYSSGVTAAHESEALGSVVRWSVREEFVGPSERNWTMANEMLCGCKTVRAKGIVFCDLHQNADQVVRALLILRGYYEETMPKSPFLKIINDALPTLHKRGG